MQETATSTNVKPQITAVVGTHPCRVKTIPNMRPSIVHVQAFVLAGLFASSGCLVTQLFVLRLSSDDDHLTRKCFYSEIMSLVIF